MKLERDIITIKNKFHYIMASTKLESIGHCAEMLGIDSQTIMGTDHERLFNQPELQANNPVEVVLSKIVQVINLFNKYLNDADNQNFRIEMESKEKKKKVSPLEVWFLGLLKLKITESDLIRKLIEEIKQSSIIFASDVVFFWDEDEEASHRIWRKSGSDPSKKQNKKMFKKAYRQIEKSKTATWHVSFGAWKKDVMRVTEKLIIEAVLPKGLDKKKSRNELKDFFEPKANPGFKLMEFLTTNEIPFTIRTESSEPVFLSPADAKRLIVDKAPLNVEMLNLLTSNDKVAGKKYFDPYTKLNYQLVILPLIQLLAA